MVCAKIFYFILNRFYRTQTEKNCVTTAIVINPICIKVAERLAHAMKRFCGDDVMAVVYQIGGIFV